MNAAFMGASFVGAGLFVAVGYLAARMKGGGEPASYDMDTGELDRLRGQLAEAERARREAENKLAAQGKSAAPSKELEQLKRDLAAARKSEGDQVAKLKQLQQQLDGQRGQLNQAQQAQQKLSALEGSVRALTNERDAALRQVEELEAAADGEKTQVQAAPSGAAAAQIEALRGELEQVKKDHAGAKKQLDMAKKQLEAHNKGAKGGATKLGMESPAAAVKVKELEQKLEATKKLAEAQRRELMDYRRQIDDLEEKHNKPSTKVGVKDPQQALRDAQADLRVARAELERSKARITQLEGELDDVRDEEPTKIKPSPTLVDDKSDELKQALGETQKDVVKLKETIEQERAKAAQYRKQAEDLERQLDEQGQLKTQAMDQQQALAAVDGKLKKLDEVENARFKLAQENKALQDEIVELKKLERLSDELEALKLESSTLKRKSEDSDRLREEKARLSEQLQTTERDKQDLQREVDGFKEAQDDRTDLALKINVLSEQLRDLERMREENMKLKGRSEQMTHLEQEMAKLREENDSLRAQGLIKAVAPALPMLDKEGDEQGLGNALQRVINRLTSEKGARAAVLADELGLVVAGVGDTVDAMAAVSAIFSEINAKIRGVLPLGTLRQLTITDANELTFSAQPFETSSGQLVLATLIPGAPPSWKTVDEWITAAVKG